MIPLPNLRPLDASAFVRRWRLPPHCVFRSAALRHYGPDGIEHIRLELGVQVHLDLRSENERRRDPDHVTKASESFKRVLRVPITTEAPVPSGPHPTAREYVDYYRHLLANATCFASAFIAVGTHCEEGVLFSCSHGKDRAGLLAAALLEAAGCPREVILSDYVRSMHSLPQSSIVEPRSWEARGLDREAYLRRYALGDSPLRILLQELDRKGTGLVELFRSGADDRAAFETVVHQISMAS